ncbi:MAG TPA: DUF1365 domain-containing protein [Caulobacteraceae bacterium]|jgi:hypothetical protein
MKSALYPGVVHHARLKPQPHKLRYRVFMMLFDLDELSEMDRRLTLFGYNRAGLLSFHDRDHGDRLSSPLRPWVEAKLASAGIPFDGGPIRLLCMPRVLGHVFNPLSLFFCYARDGVLGAILYEVNNTFGESHAYVLRADAPDAAGAVVQSCDKRFYVSPFQPMDLAYDFRIRPPGDETTTAMVVKGPDGPVLTASFHGKHEPLSDAALLHQWLAHPLLSLKVLAGIHWEAASIWLKGGKFHVNPRFGRKPNAPRLFPSAHESR